MSPSRRSPYSSPGGGRTGSRAVPAAHLYRRPTLVTLLAVLDFLSAIVLFLGAVVLLLASPDRIPQREAALAVSAGFALLGALALLSGIGLWRLKRYGRALQILLSFLGLLAVPMGTVISLLVLVYLFKPAVKLLFSETPPARLSQWEIEELGRLQQGSAVAIVLLAIVLPLVVIAVTGVLAAIAIPSFLRARVAANEASALADARSIVAAEAAYASANGGHYDELECLARPAECIPGYAADGPVFLTGPFPSVKAGYHREFVGGAPASANDVAFANLSRTSIQSFVYLAHPVSVGVTGMRSFCADYTGRICESTDGAPFAIVNGQCDPECTPPE